MPERLKAIIKKIAVISIVLFMILLYLLARVKL